jgi:uncharacterized protein (DUF427 family)
MATRFHDSRREALTFEPSSRWVRGSLGDIDVVDSRAPLLVWEPERPIVAYAFPRADVHAELLPAEAPEHAPAAREPWYDVRVGGRMLERAAWSWDDPELREHVGIAWHALERWREEDEEVFVHPRDPYHRVDALQSSRHVQVLVDGHAVADTRRPLLLFETGLPTRYYIPREDVDGDALVESDTDTTCPYKGHASYHHVHAGDALHEDLVWLYPDPLPGLQQIAGALAFWNERVDVVLDGTLQERPETPWSRRRAAHGAAG